jgi:hypothetical protein
MTKVLAAHRLNHQLGTQMRDNLAGRKFMFHKKRAGES